MDSHDSMKRCHPSGESSGCHRPRSALRPKLYRRPVVWHLRQQIANKIHIAQTGRDPLVGALAAIHHGLYEVLIEAADGAQIFTKGFEAMPAPDIEVRRRMPEWSKVFVKHILVEDGGRKHSDPPMRRQLLVPSLHGSNFLKEVFNGAMNRCANILRRGGSQGMEGVPHMVIDSRPATEAP